MEIRKNTVAIICAHPDDLIACLGFCHLAHDIFDIHVIDFTHGERGCGEEKFRSGWTKAKRTAEEEAVCASIGAMLHWLDEVDGEAYARPETVARLAAILKELAPRAVIAHWPVDVHTDHVMTSAATLKALFLADITEALPSQDEVDGQISNFKFEFSIRVTNLWPNRLIGDDFMEDYCNWRSGTNGDRRDGLWSIPDWVKRGEPSPTGRHTFTTWRHWTKDDAPLPSGLLGPVTIAVPDNESDNGMDVI